MRFIINPKFTNDGFIFIFKGKICARYLQTFFMDKFNSSEDGVLTGLGVKIRARNIALSDEIAFGTIKMDVKDDTKIVGDFHALQGCFINFTLQGGIRLSSVNGKIEYKSGLSTISSVDLPSSDQEIYSGAHAGINLFLETRL